MGKRIEVVANTGPTLTLRANMSTGKIIELYLQTHEVRDLVKSMQAYLTGRRRVVTANNARRDRTAAPPPSPRA